MDLAAQGHSRAEALWALVQRSIARRNNRTHFILLSPLEQLMPRTYLRRLFCFPFVGDDIDVAVDALERAHKAILCLFPHLSGHVALDKNGGKQSGRLELTYDDRYVKDSKLLVKVYDASEFPYTYEELRGLGMPPSKLPNFLVSNVPHDLGLDKPWAATVFQANFIRGGLILAVYAHNSVIDEFGLSIVIDHFRDFLDESVVLPDERIDQDEFRAVLDKGLAVDESLKSHREYNFPIVTTVKTPPDLSEAGSPVEEGSAKQASDILAAMARGKVFAFSNERIVTLRKFLEDNMKGAFFELGELFLLKSVLITEVLYALVWVFVTRARSRRFLNADGSPVQGKNVRTSSITLPVTIRGKMDPPVPEDFIGGTTVQSQAVLPLSRLLHKDSDSVLDLKFAGTDFKPKSATALLSSLIEIRHAMAKVDEGHVRSLISACNVTPDIRDVTLNSHYKGGMDIVVENWRALKYEDYTWEIPGIGNDKRVEFVRPPWTHQEGVMIFLPSRNPQPPRTTPLPQGAVIIDEDDSEVLIQLRTDDMDRLMQDHEFMWYVRSVVE
ncbi:hypothetical protein VTN96DRAFT_7541 [Rasamsonia emersonii]